MKPAPGHLNGGSSLRVPMHFFDEVYSESEEFGLFKWDAIAVPRKCGCADHFYLDFEERLQRFHPELHIGFDRKLGRWIIFRYVREPVTIDTGDEKLNVTHMHNFVTILMDLKWVFNVIGKDNANNFVTYPREPGDWVFEKLKKWKRSQFDAKTDWIRGKMLEDRAKEEETSAKELKRITSDWVGDCMSIADSGNPGFVRTAVRVDKKIPKKAKAKKELVTA